MNLRSQSTNRIRGLLAGPIILVIGLGMLFLGWQWRAFTQNQIATMLTTEGRVIEVVSRTKTSGGERKTYFYPVVEFRTTDGESVRFESSTGSNPSAYRVGDAVKVRYDPQTPQSAVIESWELWLPSGIMIGFGGLFLLIGILTVLNALAVLLKWGGLLGLFGLLGIILLRRKRG